MGQKKNHASIYTLLMFVVAIVWGYGFIATMRVFESGYSPDFLLLARFSIAALFFGCIKIRELVYTTKMELFGGIISGVFLFLGFALQTYGLPLTTPSNSALLTSAGVMLVPLIAWLIFKMKPTRKIIIGAIMCFVGVSILSVNPNNLSSFSIGDILTLLCAVSFALHSVCVGYFTIRAKSSVLNFYQMTTAAILSFFMFLISGSSWQQFTPRMEIKWILYLAIFSTIFAYMAQTQALKHISASKVAIITATESVIASAFSLFYGYENLTPALIIGGSLVFVAIVVVEMKPRAKTSKGV